MPPLIVKLVQRVDEWCMDSISCGVTLAYAMEYNRRHAADGKSIAGGVRFGDVEGALAAIDAIGSGQLPLLGQGLAIGFFSCTFLRFQSVVGSCRIGLTLRLILHGIRKPSRKI